MRKSGRKSKRDEMKDLSAFQCLLWQRSMSDGLLGGGAGFEDMWKQKRESRHEYKENVTSTIYGKEKFIGCRPSDPQSVIHFIKPNYLSFSLCCTNF